MEKREGRGTQESKTNGHVEGPESAELEAEETTVPDVEVRAWQWHRLRGVRGLWFEGIVLAKKGDTTGLVLMMFLPPWWGAAGTGGVCVGGPGE